MIKRIRAALDRGRAPVRATYPNRPTSEWLDAYYASERDEEAFPRDEPGCRRPSTRAPGLVSEHRHRWRRQATEPEGPPGG
jgi:hypothetical protein